MVPRRLPRRGGSPAAVLTQAFPASPAPESRAGAGAARLVIRKDGPMVETEQTQFSWQAGRERMMTMVGMELSVSTLAA